MLENVIHFKNANSLYHRQDLGDLVRHFAESTPNMDDAVNNLKKSDIREIHLITPTDPTNSQKLDALVEKLESVGFVVQTIPVSVIYNANHVTLRSLSTRILRGLKQSPSLILYEDVNRREAMFFLASIVLTLGDSRISPDRAYLLVSGEHPAPAIKDQLQSYTDHLSHKHKPALEKKQPESTTPPPPVAVADVPVEEEFAENVEEGFRASRITLRLKLASIISFIIVLSLASMTYLAVSLFKNHSTTLIQEYNLSLARLLGRKVEDELTDITNRTRLMAGILSEQTLAPTRIPYYGDLFFSQNNDYIFLGILENRNGVPVFVHRLYNEKFINNNDLTRTKIDEINNKAGVMFMKAFQGEIAVENSSPEFSKPVLSVAIPVMENGVRRVVVAHMDSSSLIQAFRSARQSDIFQVMLLNEQGMVVAHSNDEETLSRSIRMDVPIVRTMLENELDNGSRRYMFDGVNYLGSFQRLNFGRLGVISVVEEDRVFEAVYSIQRQNIIITLIVMTVAFLFIFFFTKTISNPIVRLARAAKEVEDGNYDVEIKPTTRDEIGILTHSFTHMAHGLKERELIKDTFGKFVNPSIAERAIRGGLKPGGEKRTAVVLFSDLRDFTKLSESRDPARVVEMLNGYFTEMVDCIHSTDGIVDKFIGDAIMAHWGSLHTSENDTKKAIDAALAMRQGLIRFNHRPENKDLPNLRCGVGINTGPVIVGQIGSSKKLEFTVIGDTVNLASRIEFLNKHFGTDILVSRYSMQYVQKLYKYVELPPITIKGKSQPEVVYAILGHINDPDTPASLTQLRELVGIPYDEEEAREKMSRMSSDKIVKSSGD